MTTIICKKCGIKTEKSATEILRQQKKGKLYFFCSLSCAQSYNKKTTFAIKRNCLWCKKEFESTTHKKGKKCCSLGCSHRYSQSNVDPDIHRQSVQRCSTYPREKELTCAVCGNRFTKMVKCNSETVKTCGKKCLIELMRKNARSNPNCGGDTQYRKYKYHDIWMDSRWEVELATWMDVKGIKWERSRKKHMFWWTDAAGEKRRYYPDFYLPEFDIYVDPKNKYLISVDKLKIESVIKENNIRLVWGLLPDVKKVLDNLCSMCILICG